jgi:hypothetical protein
MYTNKNFKKCIPRNKCVKNISVDKSIKSQQYKQWYAGQKDCVYSNIKKNIVLCQSEYSFKKSHIEQLE